MENLRESLLQSLSVNESRPNTRDVQNYGKSWMTSAKDSGEANQLVLAFLHGAQTGCQENAHYAREEEDQTNWNHMARLIGEMLEEME